MEDKVKRYFVACDPYVAWSLMIQVDSEGEWVKHRDHAAALASAQAEIARLREALTVVGHDVSSVLDLDLPEDHNARVYAAIALAKIDAALAPRAPIDETRAEGADRG